MIQFKHHPEHGEADRQILRWNSNYVLVFKLGLTFFWVCPFLSPRIFDEQAYFYGKMNMTRSVKA